jgi:hypothetical protein
MILLALEGFTGTQEVALNAIVETWLASYGFVNFLIMSFIFFSHFLASNQNSFAFAKSRIISSDTYHLSSIAAFTSSSQDAE